MPNAGIDGESKQNVESIYQGISPLGRNDTPRVSAMRRHPGLLQKSELQDQDDTGFTLEDLPRLMEFSDESPFWGMVADSYVENIFEETDCVLTRTHPSNDSSSAIELEADVGSDGNSSRQSHVHLRNMLDMNKVAALEAEGGLVNLAVFRALKRRGLANSSQAHKVRRKPKGGEKAEGGEPAKEGMWDKLVAHMKTGIFSLLEYLKKTKAWKFLFNRLRIEFQISLFPGGIPMVAWKCQPLHKCVSTIIGMGIAFVKAIFTLAAWIVKGVITLILAVGKTIAKLAIAGGKFVWKQGSRGFYATKSFAKAKKAQFDKWQGRDEQEFSAVVPKSEKGGNGETEVVDEGFQVSFEDLENAANDPAVQAPPEMTKADSKTLTKEMATSTEMGTQTGFDEDSVYDVDGNLIHDKQNKGVDVKEQQELGVNATDTNDPCDLCLRLKGLFKVETWDAWASLFTGGMALLKVVNIYLTTTPMNALKFFPATRDCFRWCVPGLAKRMVARLKKIVDAVVKAFMDKKEEWGNALRKATGQPEVPPPRSKSVAVGSLLDVNDLPQKEGELTTMSFEQVVGWMNRQDSWLIKGEHARWTVDGVIFSLKCGLLELPRSLRRLEALLDNARAFAASTLTLQEFDDWVSKNEDPWSNSLVKGAQ